MDKFVLRARFFHLKSVSKAFLEFEWKESKNFGNCCEAGNRFDTTVSKKRDNDGIPSQMDGIRMLFSFFFFSTLAFPLFAEEKNRGGFEGLSGILTSRRKGEGRKLTKKRLEWWNCRVILIIKS